MSGVLHDLAGKTLASLLVTMALAAVFTLLAALVTQCNKGPAWWRKPDLSTDLCWTVLPQLAYGYASTAMVVLGTMAFYGIGPRWDAAQFLAEGHGPLAGLGFWPQVALYLLGSDLVMYVTHRWFHTDRLWRFHAVHHSSEQLEWVSATRFHPVDALLHGTLSNVVMLLLGVSPEVLAAMVPFNVVTAALVHANLDWDFGPFRYVLASPVFHRWHHTSADRGGSSNFAGTFPAYDLLFGTFHMPRGERPDAYGVDEAGYPPDFFRQLVHPFRRRRDPVEVQAVSTEASSAGVAARASAPASSSS